MSHESTISDLKKLTKLELLRLDPRKHARYLLRESDRAAIILTAAFLEDHITRWLVEKMPSLNSDERAGVFNFEGPCGTFSSRIKMAQALGLLDRQERKRIEIIKEMRNTAAHSHAALQFDTPEIHQAVAALFLPDHREEIMKWKRRKIRAAFTTLTLQMAMAMIEEGKVDIEGFFSWLRVQKLKPATSRGR